MTEGELFLEWHFNDWRANNASGDSIDFAKKLYDRVYSHNHTSCIRKLEFKAWQAATQRQGFKFVLVNPTRKMIVAIENKVEQQLEASAITQDPFRLDGEKIFEAMIGAANDH